MKSKSKQSPAPLKVHLYPSHLRALEKSIAKLAVLVSDLSSEGVITARDDQDQKKHYRFNVLNELRSEVQVYVIDDARRRNDYHE